MRQAPEIAPRADERPLRADAQRNRLRVLDAARQLFAEQGREASMEEIARRAEVGVGTVYRHFATKEALIEGLARVRFEEILKRTHVELQREDAWPAIVGLFEFAAETPARDRSFAEINDDPREIEGLGPVLDELLDCWDRLIARAREQGSVRPDFSAADIPALMCGLASVVLSAPSELHWRRFLAIMLAGLRRPAAA